MTVPMQDTELVSLVNSLCTLPTETEWVEFKVDNKWHDQIGENISALSNSVTLLGKEAGYVVWGIEDHTHKIIGTTFDYRTEKHGGQEIESWLSTLLSPKPDFRFHTVDIEGKKVVLLIIPPCSHAPILWKNISYIRLGSYTKPLHEHPEKERQLWRILDKSSFEGRIAKSNLTITDILSVIDFSKYFDLLKHPLPSEQKEIITLLIQEGMVVQRFENIFDITNMGAILLAKKLTDFEGLKRKAVRVISYAGNTRISGGREYVSDAGYAVGFEHLIDYVNSQLPLNEHIGNALRENTALYPEIAIRELVANAIIHQDFTIKGTSPIIEIFADRIEVTNPGIPLIEWKRFADAPPRSRNEQMAAFMRRIGICEERGSGIDKVLNSIEVYQLPAPEFHVTTEHTQVILLSPREFKDMTSEERIKACYWHSCLLYLGRKQMTNATLRERLGVLESNYPQISIVIRDTLKAELIKPFDPDNQSRRHAKYVPYWA